MSTNEPPTSTRKPPATTDGSATATDESREPGVEISRAELIAELRRLHQQLGEPPTMRDMDFRGRYASSTYQYRFESWTAALREAGIPADER